MGLGARLVLRLSSAPMATAFCSPSRASALPHSTSHALESIGASFLLSMRVRAHMRRKTHAKSVAMHRIAPSSTPSTMCTPTEYVGKTGVEHQCTATSKASARAPAGVPTALVPVWPKATLWVPSARSSCRSSRRQATCSRSRCRSSKPRPSAPPSNTARTGPATPAIAHWRSPPPLATRSSAASRAGSSVDLGRLEGRPATGPL
mmetsp:Transcript_16309/g.44932  ORF Transcript_16309/g.44932 Transcript_16309/m.44932 type:complete len:205 (-) Transcript_16309:168-782(-)